MSEVALNGSCLCGAVHYRAKGPLGTFHHCHCKTCQKAHAAAFTTTLGVSWDGFKWTQGEPIVSFFESSPGKRRWFCPKCGTHLMADFVKTRTRRLRVASLDTPLREKPDMHIWGSHTADWFEFVDSLPVKPAGRAS